VPLGYYGQYGVTLAAAKARIREIAQDVAAKLDPIAKQKAAQARATNTVGHMLDNWIAYLRAHDRRTVERVERDLNRLVVPVLGDVVIYDLARSQVSELLTSIRDTSGKAMASRVKDWLHAAWRWQRGQDDAIERDPIPDGFAWNKPRERSLTFDELRDVWLACDEMQGPFPVIVKMLMLTGCRRMEIGALHADEIASDDLRGEYLEIPGDRMKMGKAHLVPLIPEIKRLLPEGKSGLQFTAQAFTPPNGGRMTDSLFNGWGKSKNKLDEIIARLRAAEGRKEMQPWCLHDLRRSIYTGLQALGWKDLKALERILAHSERGVARHYNKYESFEEKRIALTLWAQHIEHLATNGKDQIDYVGNCLDRSVDNIRHLDRPAR
jgi:integrase